MRVCVVNQRKKPLMPCSPRKAKILLKEGKAKVVTTKPFTIQLLVATGETKQKVTLGIDSGYKHLGFSAVTEKQELISGEVKLLDGMSERLRDRASYRRQRRQRLRYRKPRFNNRKRQEGWLAPSINHKYDSHLRMIEKLKKLLPIGQIIVEVANFDMQAIKNPAIEGKEYQQGEQAGFWNLREYILHRDGHKCQNPACTNKAANPILEVHHVGYWKQDRSDRPTNLTTLCDKCHTPKNHKESGFLWGWEPKIKSFRPETFMSIVRWRLINQLKCQYSYGYITKSNRIKFGIPKSHANDAFVVAGGTVEERAKPLQVKQVRRNNRSLQKFYDAKFVDRRTGEIVSASELPCGRRTRNKKLNEENLRKYRAKKVSKGRITIRRERSKFQPGDMVLFQGKSYQVQGAITNGKYLKLKDCKKTPRISDVQIVRYGKGFCVS